MRTKLSKEEFVKKTNLEIENRNEIVDFFEKEFIPELKKFDGKVYNARFLNAFKERLKGTLMSVNKSVYYDDSIEIRLRKNSQNYNDYEHLTIRIPLSNGGRIVFDELYTFDKEANRKTLESFMNQTKGFNDMLATYDEDIKFLEELEKTIDKVSKLNPRLRANIESFSSLNF